MNNLERVSHEQVITPNVQPPSFTLATVILAVWVGYLANRAHRQRDAIAGVRAMGGEVTYQFQSAADYSVIFDPATDKMTTRKFQSPPLSWLHQGLGDDFFCKVKTVNLDRAVGSVKPLRNINDLYDAEYVYFGSLPVDDEVLCSVSQLRKLNYLRLKSDKFTTAGLASIATMPELRTLKLCGSPVTDDGVRLISDCSSIEYLELEATRITDEGIKHLRALPNLKELNLRSTRVSDRSVDELARLTQLKKIYLSHSDVTRRGAERLGQLMPNTLVSRKPLPTD